MMRLSIAFALLLAAGLFPEALCAAAPDAERAALIRVLPSGEQPDDARLAPPRTLNDAYHAWTPPTTRDAWEQTRQAIRERALVSNGLWPAPPMEPLEPVIHGKVERDGYTVERVFFASLPGHYVSGSLYRPASGSGRRPAVLCPHGHWADGRFYDAGEKAAKDQIASGAETFTAAARHPLQARMVHLARMGCVVFHFDMIGYADSKQIEHREGFVNVDAARTDLRLQNIMGLQTANAIRALDFVASLADVDPERIAVTGASGGGTQTFMLCAVDPRPAVAFPAVMVSTAMQGGCICENAPYLRIGLNNIALAATFAPKPMAMSGADDWTIDIETKGLPELKQVYALYDAPQLVHAQAFPQFKHNYNQVSRQMMYGWLKEHLRLDDDAPVVEEDFTPLSVAEMTVYTDEHPRPSDSRPADELKAWWAEASNRQFAALVPRQAGQMDEYRRVVGTAARVMLDEGVPESEEIEVISSERKDVEGVQLRKGLVGRRGTGEQIPFLAVVPPDFNGNIVLWIDGSGKGELDESVARALVEQGSAIASIDAFGTGEYIGPGSDAAQPVDERYTGYTFGYNRPLLSNRVRDILTAIGATQQVKGVRSVQLVGTGGAGPWVMLAAALAGDRVERVIVDLDGFRFADIDKTSDPMHLPGALKYGGIGGLAALAAPVPLVIANAPQSELEPLVSVYETLGAPLTLLERWDIAPLPELLERR